MTEITEVESKAEIGTPENLSNFMKNIAKIMDRLDEIQTKIGAPSFGEKPKGLKGSLLKIFETCCPLSRNLSDEELWDQHQKIRALLDDEFIPKTSNVEKAFNQRDRFGAVETVFQNLVNEGADLSKIRLDFSSGHIKVHAKENIDPSTPFISIPSSSLILAEHFINSEGLSHLLAKDPILSSMHDILLSYGLLMEFYRGTESPYYQYIQSFPVDYKNCHYYDLQDMKVLKGSISFREALNSWKSVVRQYTYFHLKILETMDSEDAVYREYMEKYDIPSRFCFEDYRWAASTIATKSISIPSLGSNTINIALVPIVDLLKHSDTITTFDYERQGQILHVSNGFELLAGDEVTLFFGARTNSQFVLRHGFFHPNNLHEFCVIRIPLKDSHQNKEKHALLIKLGISELNGIPLGCISDIAWIGDIAAYMRIYEANDEELEKMKSIPDDEFVKRMTGQQPITELNEMNAKSSLQSILFYLIEKYKSQIDEDTQILENAQSLDRTKNIVKLKKCELSILENFLKSMDNIKSQQPPTD